VLRHRRRWQRSRPGAASSYSASRRKSAPKHRAVSCVGCNSL
jgi:hypothetical protein